MQGNQELQGSVKGRFNRAIHPGSLFKRKLSKAQKLQENYKIIKYIVSHVNAFSYKIEKHINIH
jgi:DNA polymerase II large subunit